MIRYFLSLSLSLSLYIYIYIYITKKWLLSILCKSYACLITPAIYSIPSVCIYLIYPFILVSDTSTLPVYILSQIISPRRNLESVPNHWRVPKNKIIYFPYTRSDCVCIAISEQEDNFDTSWNREKYR